MSPGLKIHFVNETMVCTNCGETILLNGTMSGGAGGILERFRDLAPSREEVEATVAVLRAAKEQDGPVAAIGEELAAASPRIAPLALEYLGANAAQWRVALDFLINALIALLSFWHPNAAGAIGMVKHVAQAAGAVLNDPVQAAGKQKAQHLAELRRRKKSETRSKNKARRHQRKK